MRLTRGRLSWAAVLGTALATLGAALAQDAAKKDDRTAAKKPGRGARKGGILAGGGAPPKDALKNEAKGKGKAARPKWPYHKRIRLTNEDGITQGATFYPSRSGDGAPVVVLVHQGGAGHSARDFEEPSEGLKGKSLAEHLQEMDYAVLIPELRPSLAAVPAHNANPAPKAQGKREEVARRELTARELAAVVADLRSAYLYLIDQHNRGELNVGKLGVIGVGDGATLATAWAAAAYPSGPIANPGRISDVGALVIVSPTAEAYGLRLAPNLQALAPRLPILMLAGEKDAELTKAARPVIERPRLPSKVTTFETKLQGDVLLRYEPKAVEALAKFLEEPVKFRANSDWEPRYLLSPIAYTDVETISSKDAARKGAAGKDEAPGKKDAAKKPAERAKD